MNEMEKRLKKTLVRLMDYLPGKYLADIGAVDMQIVSTRSVRFDLPPGSAGSGGVNRIKITLQENGEFRLRTSIVTEVEDVPNIAPDNLTTAITKIAGVDIKKEPQ